MRIADHGLQWWLLSALQVAAIALVVLLVVAVLRGRFRSWLNHQAGLSSEVVRLTTRTITAALLGLGVYVVLAYAFDSSNAAVTGVLVAAILTGIGFQDLMRSYVSGFYVVFERNIRVGQWIDLGLGVEGQVTRMSLRVTYLRDREGRTIVAPNAEIFSRVIRILAAPTDVPSGGERAQDDAGEGLEP